jgi:hypothetical protein
MAESNSVFISYRRSASGFLALAVFQDLTSNGTPTGRVNTPQHCPVEQAQVIQLNPNRPHPIL